MLTPLLLLLILPGHAAFTRGLRPGRSLQRVAAGLQDVDTHMPSHAAHTACNAFHHTHIVGLLY